MNRQTTEQALLTAILANPDDDAPRLIYADWLDENGQPERAEFIRVQCELASGHFDDERFDKLKERQDTLLNENETVWRCELGVQDVPQVQFRRGFVEAIATTASDLIRYGGGWVERTPLRSLTLNALAGNAQRLAACSHLRPIASLDIQDGAVGNQDIEALSRCPHLPALRSLAIEGDPHFATVTKVLDQGLRHLGDAPFLPQLTYLALNFGVRSVSAGVIALAAQLVESGLQRVHLGWGLLSDAAAVALAAAPGLDSLTHLCLPGSDIGDTGLRALATSLPTLRWLSLCSSRVTGTGLAALAGVAHRCSLEWLNLSRNRVRSIDLDVLALLLQALPDLSLSLKGRSLSRRVKEEIVQRFAGRVDVDL
jgi:uncharacterized protein (TIGR02996 family)